MELRKVHPEVMNELMFELMKLSQFKDKGYSYEVIYETARENLRRKHLTESHKWWVRVRAK